MDGCFAMVFSVLYQVLNILGPKLDLGSGMKTSIPASYSSQDKWNFIKAVSSVPSLEFRPTSNNYSSENAILHFQHGSSGKNSWQPLVDSLQQLIANNEERQNNEYITHCDFNNPGGEGKLCYFDIRQLGMNCTVERFFGYDQGSPCVLIMMEKILDWVPETYAASDVPPEMPANARDVIRKWFSGRKGSIVWLSCDGEKPADRENIGSISYAPLPGFAGYFFPYINHRDYVSPFVMVEFLNPKHGVTINIECKAWAKNIANNSTKQTSSVRFQLLID